MRARFWDLCVEVFNYYPTRLGEVPSTCNLTRAVEIACSDVAWQARGLILSLGISSGGSPRYSSMQFPILFDEGMQTELDCHPKLVWSLIEYFYDYPNALLITVPLRILFLLPISVSLIRYLLLVSLNSAIQGVS